MQRPDSIATNHNQNTMSSSTSSHSQQQQQQQQQHASPPSNWIINDDTLRDVPNFYPLEKSSKYIPDYPSRIADRISDCCRIMSVQAHFDNDLVRKRVLYYYFNYYYCFDFDGSYCLCLLVCWF